MTDIDRWNLTVKNYETEVKAVPGDIVITIGGVIFLLQTSGGYNNIVCWRIKDSYISIRQAFVMFGNYLVHKGIQYVRVEGNLRRYFFLAKLGPYFPKGYNVIKVDENIARNIFYIRLYSN